MLSLIDTRFGTLRGAVRLGLSYGEVALGAAQRRPADLASVRRVVFVCHGNICRSAYADVLARGRGIATASFGLSTGTGKPAHPPVAQEAARRGIDLAGHGSLALEDYRPLEGDYLLAMEVRHLRRLAQIGATAALPRDLLGIYARAPFPHLHDPYKIAASYLPICLTRIEDAVARLADRLAAARAPAIVPPSGGEPAA